MIGQWYIADSTQGFMLEYWTNDPRKCLVSLKADCDVETLQAVMGLLRALKMKPRQLVNPPVQHEWKEPIL